MAVDFDRLKAGQVITTGRPPRQADERLRFLIYTVNRILKETREVLVKTQDGADSLLTEVQLQTMFLVEISLSHFYRQAGGFNRPADSAIMQLFLAICQEAARNNSGFKAYLKELSSPDQKPDEEAMKRVLLGLVEQLKKSPAMKKMAKGILQERLEGQTRVDFSAKNFKERGIADMTARA